MFTAMKLYYCAATVKYLSTSFCSFQDSWKQMTCPAFVMAVLFLTLFLERKSYLWLSN